MKFIVPLLLLASLLSGRLVMAQRIVVTGQVIEAASGEPIPGASVSTPKGSIGTATDIEGKFKLNLPASADSLIVRGVGYATLRRHLTDAPEQKVLFRLRKGGVALKEVVVYSRKPENPAFRILREVQRHKPDNERTSLTAAEYSSYNRIEVSLSDIPKSLANRKVVKDIRALAVRRGAAAASDPDAPLPLFASEVGSRVYQKYGPLRRREDILHKQMRGAGPREGSVLSQMLGSNFQNFDFYPNWQNILGKDFVSPISAGGRLTYDYELQDSLFVEKDWCYKIAVTPRRSHDLAFTGLIWITAKTYALRRIDVVTGAEANINFISDLRIFQDLTSPADGPGLAARTRLILGVRPYEKQAAMRVRFTTVNSDFVRNKVHEESGFFDQPIVSSLLEPSSSAGNSSSLISGLPGQGATGPGYFDLHRPDTLSLSEQQVFAVLDSARQLPSVRSTLDWIDLFINGYKHVGGETGKIEIGPIINTFAVNNFEGARLRFGFRTTPTFSRNWVLQPYVAYGVKDGRFKYGLKGNYIAERRHWTVFNTEYRHDVEQAALLDNDFLPDNNLFVAASRWGRFTEGRPILRDLMTLGVQRDLFHGFTQSITLREQHVKYLNDYFTPIEDRKGVPGDVTLSELVLESRYAPDENLVQSENRRRAIGLRKWPVFGFRYIIGARDFFSDSKVPYQKFNLSIQHSVSAGHFGRLNYRLEGNYTDDRLPAAFLKIPLGNQTPFYNANAFNLMNYFEFVTDRSVSLRLDHHFEGVILNAIPGIRRFNWRLVATANALYGGLQDKNQRARRMLPGGNMLYEYPTLGHMPYVEVGYGVENIFKFIRVDFIHRVTHREDVNPDPSVQDPRNFGIKVGAQFRL